MAKGRTLSTLFHRMKPYLGQGLVFAGALLLFAGYLLGWTSSNVFLVCCILLIIVGIWSFVRVTKEN